MSAAELRQAAETLRARADHASDDTGAPWTAQVHDDGRAWINAPDEPHAISMHGWPAAARYVATMHPGVGLALARLLEDVAAGWVWDDPDAVQDYDGDPLTLEGSMDSHALTLARLINGGAS